MKKEEMVFPFDKAYKDFERQVGESVALKLEVEILRSIYMELGSEQRDKVKNLEAIARKKYLNK